MIDFLNRMGRGFAPEGQSDPAMSQALMQFGAGMLSNPTGNFARNVGAAVPGALSRYNEVGQIQDQRAARAQNAELVKAQMTAAQRKAEMEQRKALQDALQGGIGMLRQQREQAVFSGDKAAEQRLDAQITGLTKQWMGATGIGMPDPQASDVPIALGTTAAQTGKAGPTREAAQTLGMLRSSNAPGAMAAPQGGMQGGAPPALNTDFYERLVRAGVDPKRVDQVAKAIELRKPQVVAGGSYTLGPEGQQQFLPEIPEGMVPTAGGGAATMPGVMQDFAARQAIQNNARARADNAIRPIEGVAPDGSKTMGYAPNVLGAPPLPGGGGGAVAAPVNMQRPQPAPMQPAAVPISAGGGRVRTPILPGQQPPPGTTAPQAMPALPAVSQAANAALAQQRAGGMTSITPSKRQADIMELNGQLANQFYTKEIPEIRESISGNRESLRVMEETHRLMLEGGLQQGFLQPYKDAAKGLFADLGLGSFAKDLEPQQAFRALFEDQRLARQMLQNGVQTEGDAQRMGATWVSVQNTPRANELINAYAMAVTRMKLAKDQFMIEEGTKFRIAGDPKSRDEMEALWMQERSRPLPGLGRPPSIWDYPELAKFATPGVAR